jgi:hypothetical protein
MPISINECAGETQSLRNNVNVVLNKALFTKINILKPCILKRKALTFSKHADCPLPIVCLMCQTICITLRQKYFGSRKIT